MYNEGIEGAGPRKVVFPDWGNPALAAFLQDFYSRFAQEFDQDPRLCCVEVGFGLWGEYHIDFDNLRSVSDPSVTTVGQALGRLFPSVQDQVAVLSPPFGPEGEDLPVEAPEFLLEALDGPPVLRSHGLDQGLKTHPGGNLAGLVAAHAVGHGEDPPGGAEGSFDWPP